MATLLYSHLSSQWHEMPAGHPECAARAVAVEAALAVPAFAALHRAEAPEADLADVLRAHPQAHLDALRAALPAAGTRALDADTHVGPRSLEAALRGVGAACAAVDAVIAGEVANAFCALRPPGHHAEPARAMGFCLLGSLVKRALRGDAQRAQQA